MPVTIYSTLAKTALDATTDQPVNARAQLEAAIDALNSLRTQIDSLGITQPGDGIEIVAAGAGVKDGASVKLDGASLARSASGLKIAAAGILLSMLGQNSATNGQIIQWDSSLNAGAGGWKAASPASSGNQKLKKAVFSTPGSSNWTIPTGVTEAKVTVVAGGGNGGGATSTSTCVGGGGGGGGAAIKWLTGLTPGAQINMTVGGQGGDSYSGAVGSPTCKATAGSNGTANGANAAGGGGAGIGTVGDVLIRGQDGGSGLVSATNGGVGGTGGSSILGGGGSGGAAAVNNQQSGNSGGNYGGGGGGAARSNGSSVSGGGGAGGLIIVEYVEA